MNEATALPEQVIRNLEIRIVKAGEEWRLDCTDYGLRTPRDNAGAHGIMRLTLKGDSLQEAWERLLQAIEIRLTKEPVTTEQALAHPIQIIALPSKCPECGQIALLHPYGVSILWAEHEQPLAWMCQQCLDVSDDFEPQSRFIKTISYPKHTLAKLRTTVAGQCREPSIMAQIRHALTA